MSNTIESFSTSISRMSICRESMNFWRDHSLSMPKPAKASMSVIPEVCLDHHGITLKTAATKSQYHDMFQTAVTKCHDATESKN